VVCLKAKPSSKRHDWQQRAEVEHAAGLDADHPALIAEGGRLIAEGGRNHTTTPQSQ
jgi:hypothetical protein